MKTFYAPATDGTEGAGQGQGDAQLGAAMDNWGGGEQDSQQTTQTTQQQAAPAQTQQGATETTQQTAAPATTQQPAATVAPVQDTASIIRAAVESTAQAMQRTQGQT